MTDYRVVVRHVRYWRGAVHKWSTVYPLNGSVSSGDYASICDVAHTLDNGVCFPGSVGLAGGIYEVSLYNVATGGVPIAVHNYFDPDVPSAWLAYTGSGWPSGPTIVEPAAEVALQVEWNAGFSSSGKPVRFRKWYHAVPVADSSPGAPDLDSDQLTSLAAWLNVRVSSFAAYGAVLGNASRLASTTPQISPYYGNHQMPRGRKRKPLKVSSATVKLPAGILVVPGSDGSLDS